MSMMRFGLFFPKLAEHGFDPPGKDDLVPAQTFLDPLNRQSRWSDALLDLFVNLVLPDENYRQRLQRHYRLVKDAVADPAHPCHRLLRESKLSGPDADVAARRSPIARPPRRRKGKRR